VLHKEENHLPARPAALSVFRRVRRIAFTLRSACLFWIDARVVDSPQLMMYLEEVCSKTTSKDGSVSAVRGDMTRTCHRMVPVPMGAVSEE